MPRPAKDSHVTIREAHVCTKRGGHVTQTGEFAKRVDALSEVRSQDLDGSVSPDL